VKQAVEYLSFGGGSPSMALAILNAQGKVEPRAEFAIFADTGWERQATYEAVDSSREWLEARGLEVVTVQAPEGALDQNIYGQDKNMPLPVFVDGGGMGPRRCTDRWKVRIIRGYVSRRFGRGTPQVVQLGLHYDEIQRMKDSKVKRDRNRWPLIELKLGRQACDEIVRSVGLTVPPRSACIGCPFHSRASWQRVASESPEDFERACQMDDYLHERSKRLGWPDMFLSSQRQRLRTVVSPDQLTMLRGADLEPTGDLCESGYCWT